MIRGDDGRGRAREQSDAAKVVGDRRVELGPRKTTDRGRDPDRPRTGRGGAAGRNVDIQSGQRRHEIVGACACDDCPDKKDFFPLDWFDDDHPVLVDEYTVFKSGKVNKDYDPRARRADGRSDESSRDSPRRRRVRG